MMAVTKIVGTGNDFLFIDARQEPPGHYGASSRPDLAKKLCDRHFGIGADGLVFVENSDQQNILQWDFYNSDGSSAEMCGNASRCMGRWAKEKLGLSEVQFKTAAGLVRAKVEIDSDISVHLDYLALSFSTLEYGSGKKATFLNTGVPHAVVEISDISQARNASADIQALRFHPGAGPRGTNVTFLQVLAPERFATMTFERGVEGFTLSCGTGVLAAAAVGLRKTDPAVNSAKLHTPGGQLQVSYDRSKEQWSKAVLKGPAQLIFDAEVSQEVLK